MTKRDRPESVPRHPMRLVTRRTGLTPARLRIWERRYGVVRPGRTGGGQRLYSDDDIARLALLARATDAGHALPQIAKLSRDALTALLERDEPVPSATTAGSPDPALTDRLIGHVERLDGGGLERALRRAALSRGATAFAEGVVGPFLQAIGERWHGGTLSPAHEHLASAVVGRVIGWVTGQFLASDAAPAVVVATPQGERHELGAAVVAAAAAEAGWRVVYLGPDLPVADIAAAAAEIRARAVALSLVHTAEARSLGGEVARLAERLGRRVPLAIGGPAAAHTPATAQAAAHVCATLADFRTFLDGAREAHA